MNIREKASAYKEYSIALRREFHQNPELGQEEYRTAKRIEEELDKLGIAHYRAADTNVIGILNASKKGKTVALRADMDALPIQEETNAPYASAKNGIMHACGHDAHTAALLGAAKILGEERENLNGTVKFLFQSAEEKGTGALEIISSGALDDADCVFGMHIWNNLDFGKVFVAEGAEMASAIEFQVYLEGKGGHGSESNKAIDATIPIAALAMQLQTIVSMEMNPLSDVVLTIGRMYSGPNCFVEPGAIYNVVSGNSYLEGTIRVFSDEDSERFREKIERMVHGIEILYGVKGKFIWNVHAPAVINDEGLAEAVKHSCIKLWGNESLDENLGKQMAAEDFSFYRQKTKSVFSFVGSRNEEKLKCYPHHHAKFNIDEDAIERATCLYAQFAIDFLNQE